MFGWLNISIRQDALAGRNPAAVWACAGGLLGVELTYAGGNIGAGDETVTTFIAAAMASVGLIVLWFVLEFFTRISDAVTIERDLTSGVRLAGFLVAIGLIFGRAVAGDWVSLSGTWNDFRRDGVGAVALLAGACIAEKHLQPTFEKPRPSVLICGVIPAMLYLSASAGWVVYLGWWK